MWNIDKSFPSSRYRALLLRSSAISGARILSCRKRYDTLLSRSRGYDRGGYVQESLINEIVIEMELSYLSARGSTATDLIYRKPRRHPWDNNNYVRIHDLRACRDIATDINIDEETVRRYHFVSDWLKTWSENQLHVECHRDLNRRDYFVRDSFNRVTVFFLFNFEISYW